MRKILLKSFSVLMTVSFAATANAAGADSGFIAAKSAPMPVQSYVPFNGSVDLNSNFLLKRGIQNYVDGDYTTAAMLLHRSLRGNPNEGFANYYMGLTKAKIGNNRGALPYLKRANKIFANAPQSYAALGEAYAKTGQLEKAQRVLTALETVKTCSINCPSASDINSAKMVIKRAIGQ